MSGALEVARRACDAFDARDWDTYRDCLGEALVYRSGARGEFDRETALAMDRAMAEAIDAHMERDGGSATERVWPGDGG